MKELPWRSTPQKSIFSVLMVIFFTAAPIFGTLCNQVQVMISSLLVSNIIHLRNSKKYRAWTLAIFLWQCTPSTVTNNRPAQCKNLYIVEVSVWRVYVLAHLQCEGDRNTNYEEEEGHDEVCQGAAVPWWVVNPLISPTGIVHQYHKLQARKFNSLYDGI